MDTADRMRRLPVLEAEKMQDIGGDLYVDRVRGKRLLIQPQTPKTDLDRYEAAGLQLPQGAKEKYTPMDNFGFIVKVGDGVPPGEYEPGEAVMYSKWCGITFTENKTTGLHKIINTDDVLCTLCVKEGNIEDAMRPATKEEAA